MGGPILNDVGDEAGEWGVDVWLEFRGIKIRRPLPASLMGFASIEHLASTVGTEATGLQTDSPYDCADCGEISWPCSCLEWSE